MSAKELIRPERLRPGDAIGIAAPAGAFKAEPLEAGLAILRQWGLLPIVPEGLFEKWHYFAGPDAHRAAVLNRLFADEQIKGILCVRGGYGAIRVLPFLDLDLIRQNPKVVIGFSDITALLVHLYARCGLLTFHGPMAATLQDAGPEGLAGFWDAVSKPAPFAVRPARGDVLRPGTAEGPVIGGNLTTLCHLTGTPYQPDCRGHIMLLEDRNEALYRVDRMLSQMKMAGWFDGLRGIVLGDFTGCGSYQKICRLFQEVFEDQALPILAGLDVGHGSRNLTIPLGLYARLEADNHVLRFLHSPTR